ncbi:EspA/EspE family type VII secretion system effector [Mycobacterium sp. 050134]|uniref:EspA/EspE family type VII secretion system effector n=1 Tax=Mycobacterium sp. 050134 TaxID=3096111 RepID=UPI002EDAB78C
MNALADAARILGNIVAMGPQFIGLDADLTPPGMETGGGGESLAATVTGMTGSLGGMFSSRTILKGIDLTASPIVKWERDIIRSPGYKASNFRQWVHNNVTYQASARSQVANAGVTLDLDPDTNREIKSPGANTTPVANIIPWTITVVGYMEWLLGLAPPSDGADLESGSRQFAELAEQLKVAFPNQNWRGTASEAYGEFAATLQETALQLAKLDAEFADVVKSQGEWVGHMRLGFGILTNILTAAIFVEVALRMAWSINGDAIAKVFAITVSGLAITLALGMLSTAAGLSVEHAKKADELTSRYETLVQAATAKSTVSDFQAISNSMSGGAGAAPSPRAARGHDTPTAYRTNTDDTAAQTTPSTTTAAAGTLPFALPTVTMPTLAQVATMSGQSARVSGQLAQHVNLFNQAMGQVQQIAQMAQQNQPAPPPAPDAETATDVNAETGEDTDAAAGSPDGQRAPVAQTQSAPQPGGERIL